MTRLKVGEFTYVWPIVYGKLLLATERQTKFESS